MAASPSAKRSPRPHLPLAEKRRIVELTLGKGASIRAVAHEHGISRNSLRRWQALYRAGELTPPPARRARAGKSSATLLPITLAPTPRLARSARLLGAESCAAVIVELRFSPGSVMRIETGVLDTALIRTLIAELRR